MHVLMSTNGVPDLESLLHFVCERDTSFSPENTLLIRAAATPMQHAFRLVQCSCNDNNGVLLAKVLKRGYCARRSCAFPLHAISACMHFRELFRRPLSASLYRADALMLYHVMYLCHVRVMPDGTGLFHEFTSIVLISMLRLRLHCWRCA